MSFWHLNRVMLRPNRRINHEAHMIPLHPKHPLGDDLHRILRRCEEYDIADLDLAPPDGDPIHEDDIAGQIESWEHAGASNQGDAANVGVEDVDAAGGLDDDEGAV